MNRSKRQRVPEGAASTPLRSVPSAPSGLRGQPGRWTVEDKVSAIRELMAGKATVD